MKGRGNYSWSFAKKSFTLKLDKKPTSAGWARARSGPWSPTHYDKSLLRNAAAFNIGSKLTNMAWTPQVEAGRPLRQRLLPRPLPAGRADHDRRGPGRHRRAEERVRRRTRPGPTTTDARTSPAATSWSGTSARAPTTTSTAGNGAAGSGSRRPEDEDDDTRHHQAAGQLHQQLPRRDATRRCTARSWKNNTTGWKKYIDENSAVDYYIAHGDHEAGRRQHVGQRLHVQARAPEQRQALLRPDVGLRPRGRARPTGPATR